MLVKGGQGVETTRTDLGVSTPIVLHSSSDHYDACVKVKPLEIHNVITDRSDINENLPQCAVKSGFDISNIHETIYKEPIRVDDKALHNETKNLSGIVDTTVGLNHTRHRVIHVIC